MLFHSEPAGITVFIKILGTNQDCRSSHHVQSIPRIHKWDSEIGLATWSLTLVASIGGKTSETKIYLQIEKFVMSAIQLCVENPNFAPSLVSVAGLNSQHLRKLGKLRKSCAKASSKFL